MRQPFCQSSCSTPAVDGVGDAGGFHPGVDGGQGLGRLRPRLQIDVDDDHVPGLFQQFGLDQVHMGDLGHLLFQVAVVFNINAAFGDHGRGGFGLLGVPVGHRQPDIGPFHSVCLLCGVGVDGISIP